jgi:hypothetical protein
MKINIIADITPSFIKIAPIKVIKKELLQNGVSKLWDGIASERIIEILMKK